MGKIATSAILKLFINGNETRHTTDAPYHMSETLLSNVNTHRSMIQEDQKDITTQRCGTGRHFTKQH